MKFKIKLLATFVVITLLLGCETQEDFVKESGKKINTETVSFKTLFSKIQNKRMNASGKNLFQQKSTGNLNRSEEDFIKDIDTTTIEKVVIDGKESYTLRIITEDDTEDRFYNMVVYEKDGVYYTNYIRYDGIDDTKEGAEKVINSIKTAVDEDGIEFSDANPQENKDNCSSFAPIWQCSCGNAHSPNDAEGPNAICIAESWMVVGFTEINVPCSGDAQGNAPNHPSGNEAPAGTTPSSNQSGGGSGSGSGSTSPVYTIPVTPKKTAKQIKLAFTASLATHPDELNWWLALPNKPIVDEIVAYLTDNQAIFVEEQTPFDFAIECINRIRLNPTVFTSFKPFVIEKQIDDSQVDPCTKGILDKLKSLQQNDIAKIIARFDNPTSAFSLNINQAVIPIQPNGDIRLGETSAPINNSYDITLNSTYFNDNGSTNLIKAQVILHEIMHALIYSIVYNPQSTTNPDPNDFPAIWNAYVNHEFGNNNDNHHVFLGLNYINIIGAALQEYDTGVPVPDGQTPLQLYTDVAWCGFIKIPQTTLTTPFDSILSGTDKARLYGRLNAEKSKAYSNGTYPSSNNPCSN